MWKANPVPLCDENITPHNMLHNGGAHKKTYAKLSTVMHSSGRSSLPHTAVQLKGFYGTFVRAGDVIIPCVNMLRFGPQHVLHSSSSEFDPVRVVTTQDLVGLLLWTFIQSVVGALQRG